MTQAVEHARSHADALWRSGADTLERGGRPHVAPPQWSKSRIPDIFNASPIAGHDKVVMCVVGDAVGGALPCAFSKLVPLADLSSQALQTLSQSTIFFQLINKTVENSPEYIAPSLVEVGLVGGEGESERVVGDNHTPTSIATGAMLAAFGPDLLPACNRSAPGRESAARGEWEEKVREARRVVAGDEEEVSEDGESEEDVRKRIEAVERGDVKVVTVKAGGGRGGHQIFGCAGHRGGCYSAEDASPEYGGHRR